ncbi:haloacid dehalogenase type II [Amycolatopsis rhabdoformis]|uniref:Haloacid dehalogenase type II n=1 Tax=Amycolatopsis rhabdoformis TaxID=1448059 RepID=A0ABZ1ILB8_9PSEU|nr:haloacid dehalogenase type II [Amycolatopsis rhabdoformis]WSE34578.1 haloacid dehalogenase type II [Amycolatopsis rhabdoformis]
MSHPNQTRPDAPFRNEPEGTETLVFDVYGTLVDPISVTETLARELGADTGVAIARSWRARQLEYSFRLTVMGQYVDFHHVTRHALIDALAAHEVKDDCPVEEWCGLYDTLHPFPGTASALSDLRSAGHRLTVFTNGTKAMVERCLSESGLLDCFDDVISADEVKAFKPSPAVYRHASDRTGRPLDELRLVSSNPFDIIGAHRSGMRTAWIRRTSAPFDSLGAAPDIAVGSLDLLPQALAGELPGGPA